MPTRKKVRDPPFWVTGRGAGKTKNHQPLPFVQLYADLLQDPAFYELPPSARLVYVCMALEAKGKAGFEFSHSTAQRFGISDTTLRTAVKQLVAAGFLKNESGRFNHQSSRYTFLIDWKTRPAPAAYKQPKHRPPKTV